VSPPIKADAPVARGVGVRLGKTAEAIRSIAVAWFVVIFGWAR
jgi:hypothetical protein